MKWTAKPGRVFMRSPSGQVRLDDEGKMEICKRLDDLFGEEYSWIPLRRMEAGFELVKWPGKKEGEQRFIRILPYTTSFEYVHSGIFPSGKSFKYTLEYSSETYTEWPLRDRTRLFIVLSEHGVMSKKPTKK